jgi:RNase H-fold protein (predicted Holliday junction resolvase)
MIVLGIDPGRKKCGLAVVCSQRGVLAHQVVPTEALGSAVQALIAELAPAQLVLGDGTQSKTVLEILGSALPIAVISEGHTTERARVRYWQENPPRGLMRLWPTSLRTPPIPMDDWAAVILAEDWLISLS